jgi:hypothetical protein
MGGIEEGVFWDEGWEVLKREAYGMWDGRCRGGKLLG